MNVMQAERTSGLQPMHDLRDGLARVTQLREGDFHHPFRLSDLNFFEKHGFLGLRRRAMGQDLNN
jgi:hypothetical protein